MKQQLLVLVEWAKYIPAFCELPLDDQVEVKEILNALKMFFELCPVFCILLIIFIIDLPYLTKVKLSIRKSLAFLSIHLFVLSRGTAVWLLV